MTTQQRAANTLPDASISGCPPKNPQRRNAHCAPVRQPRRAPPQHLVKPKHHARPLKHARHQHLVKVKLPRQTAQARPAAAPRPAPQCDIEVEGTRENNPRINKLRAASRGCPFFWFRGVRIAMRAASRLSRKLGLYC